jgi:hypothetical protein
MVLATAFMSYYVSVADRAIARNEHPDTAREELGRAPWDVANSLLAGMGFKYELTKPESLSAQFDLRCRLRMVPLDLSNAYRELTA